MRKVLLIGAKDFLLVMRDPAALLFMLLAPFLLTVGMGLITGNLLGGGSVGIGDIPVALAIEDRGAAGGSLLQYLRSPDIEGLLKATTSPDAAAARSLVDSDKAAAALIVPSGFTASLSSTPSPLILYMNPNSGAAAGVVLDIVTAYADRLQATRLGAGASVAKAAITVHTTQGGNAGGGFNPLAYIAPGMALMFLMYRVSHGGRSLLVERAQGTLSRLLVSPTTAAQVLGGKMLGIFATGTAQVLVLIVASTLLFKLYWGDPVGVVVLVLAAVAGATGWGLLLTALARTPGQVSAIGAALMLIFGILGGGFVSMDAMPGWVRLASRITPNAWGLDAFSTLALGGSLPDIGRPLLALLVMAVALFSVSTVLLTRRGLAKE
jgi:ABC-2 type transport system permease protein